jgi:hypothetical protein
MKHTQGPWITLERYTDRNSIPIGHKRPDGATSIFAECNGLGGVTGQTEGDANARLIAAAPELLAALQELVLAPNKFRPDSRSQRHVPFEASCPYEYGWMIWSGFLIRVIAEAQAHRVRTAEAGMQEVQGGYAEPGSGMVPVLRPEWGVVAPALVQPNGQRPEQARA